MQSPKVDLSRRRVLRFAGAMPAVLGAGGLAACNPNDPPHGVDEPHLVGSADDRIWQELETAARNQVAGLPTVPSSVAQMDGEMTLLSGFLRRTPARNRLILTRRAVGCPACAQQKLWPVVEVQLESEQPPPANGRAQLQGALEIRRFGGQLPLALKSAKIIST